MIAIVVATNLPLWPRCQISHFDRGLQFGTFLLATCGLEGQRIWGDLGAATNMREEDGQQIWPGSAVWCVEWNFPFCRPEHFPICCLLAPIFPPTAVESLPTNSLLLYWAKVNVKKDVFFHRQVIYEPLREDFYFVRLNKAWMKQLLENIGKNQKGISIT